MSVNLDSQRASNLFDLRGVVAVVTGGSSGIGLMISSTLVANGATVYIIGLKQEELDRIARIYNEASAGVQGGKMIGLEGDVSLKSEAKRLAAEISEREPYVTVLFNNAAIQGGFLKLPETPSAERYTSTVFDAVQPEHFDKILNTNAVGPFWMTFAFLPLLEKWKKSEEEVTKKFVPQVVMTSSMNGWTKDSITAERSYPYLFSKSAIGQATATLAHELLPLGIRVNGIAPGLFPTEMSFPGNTNEAGVTSIPSNYKEKFPFALPAGMGTKRDVGALALCLVANWFINGETVLIDGGTLLQHPSSY